MRHRWTTWTLKALAGIGLAASLSACNLVITTEPTYVAADAAGAPVLKDGLWVNLKPDCAVDLKTPATGWPECAGWVVVKGSAMTGVGDNGERFNVPFVLAAGDPRVMQVEIEDKELGPKMYLYLGVRPLKTDPQGRIVEYTGWIVQCGPPPPDGTKRENGQPRFGTLQPAPGMIMDAEQSGCRPKDKAALTGAARLSEAYDGNASKGEVSRWLRDGDR